MIAPDRPLCIMEYNKPSDIIERIHDSFDRFGVWTLADEPYSECQLEWEACTAVFVKQVDGQTFYVKCMEPAMWWLHSRNPILGGGSYCHYHKPIVRPIS